MKKISYFCMAAVAFLLGACTNAEPFEGITDNTGGGQYVIPEGTGTEADPLNVSAALVHDMDSSVVWVKGYIVGQVAGTSVNADSQFGPDFSGAVYDDGTVSKFGTNLLIAATPEETSTSACLVIQLPSGVLREQLNLVQHPENDGKAVALKGQLIKYFGVAGMKNTTDAKLEGNVVGGGSTPSGDSKGDGTQNNPYNIAGAVSQNNSGASAWVKGYIVGQVAGSSLNEESQFVPPFTPAVYDDGTTATAGTNLLIADKVDETNASNCMIVQLPAGDLRTALELVNHPENHAKEVMIYGVLTKYFGTYGLKSCSCAIFEGNTIGTLPSAPVTPDVQGDGSRNNPYNASGAMAQNNNGNTVWVKTYIVGQVAGKSLGENAQFAAPFTLAEGSTQGTNLLVADKTDETNSANCLIVQLPSGAVRNGINLVDNPGLDGKEVLLYGKLEKYFGANGLKGVTCAIVDGTTYGTDPGAGGGDEPSGNAIFEESFATSLGAFTAYNKTIPPELSYVWSYDDRYKCAKASAYMKSTAYETESWLVSPVIATNGKAATLTFDHAANFFTAQTEEMRLFYSTDYAGDVATATWQQLAIPTYASDWTFVGSGNIELPAAEGVSIAFVYVSTASNACTWEVKNVKVVQ